MTWAATAVGAVAVGTSVYGSISGSKAAGRAADEQREASQRYANMVRESKDRAFGLVDNARDIASYDQALTAKRQLVNQSTELANSINPNLIDIGKQLHGLLNGQSAPILDNLKQQRGLARQQLVDRLNQQMGPGGQTSSAGIKALNEFDQQTSNILAQKQDEYTSDFMKTSLAAPEVMNALGSQSTSLASMSTLSPEARKAQLEMGFTGAQGEASRAQIEAAGSDQVAGQLQGQMWQQIGAAGIQGLGAYMGGKYNQPGSMTPGGTNPTSGMGTSSLSMPQLGSQFSGGGMPAGTLGADLSGNSAGMVAKGSTYSPAGYSPNGPGPWASGYQMPSMPNYANVPNYRTLNQSMNTAGF